MRYLIIIFLCVHSVLFAQEEMNADNIQTVQLYPFHPDDENATLDAPSIPLYSELPLVLEFDDLNEEYSFYKAKLLYFNYDWTPSDLQDINFLEDYNEFTLPQAEPSYATKIPYYHYTFEVPPVKTSGNYAIIIYNEDDVDKPVLLRRFVVYEPGIDINLELNRSTAQLRNEQAINFTAQYGNGIVFPRQNLKIAIRKNQRWDNMKTEVSPTFINDYARTIQLIDSEENTFDGGNEYRKFDMRSTHVTGINIHSIDRGDTNYVWLRIDEPDITQTYQTVQDINGKYVIDNYEYGDGDIESDYTLTQFTLKSDKINQDIYVFGGLSDFKIDERFKMTYNPGNNNYTCTALIKQGYYNYKYVTVDAKGNIDELALENSYFETENEYEIYIYYTTPENREDFLIGYYQFNINPK